MGKWENVIYLCFETKSKAMDFKKKSTQDAGVKGVNVRLSPNGYDVIRKFCVENNYKIGAYTEVATLEKIEKEKQKAAKTNSK